MLNNDFIELEACYNRLTSMGSYYPLKVKFKPESLESDLSAQHNNWVHYNKTKPHIGRFGLSLFSLRGETSGEIDLNSILEYNRNNKSNYQESDFATPTPYWHEMKSISEPLSELEEFLGRSHIIKFNVGGHFPVHRDRGDTFRLVSFFNCSPNELVFMLDAKRIQFEPCRIYFIDTRKPHCVFSFKQDTMILVLNVKINRESIHAVEKKLLNP